MQEALWGLALDHHDQLDAHEAGNSSQEQLYALGVLSKRAPFISTKGHLGTRARTWQGKASPRLRLGK